MKKSGTSPVRVALYGMDPRGYKTMEMYLKGPCRGIAVVVDQAHAEVDMIDADFAKARDILEARRSQTPDRPIILLSLKPLKIENTFFIQKPVSAKALAEVLLAARPPKIVARPDVEPPSARKIEADTSVQPAETQARKVSKQQAALLDNEGGFTTFLGTLAEIDFSNPEQLLKANYEPKKYFLGFVQSAYKVALHQAKAVQLNSMWKPLLIFPNQRQIWLDADDKQLRSFAGMEQNKISGNTISLVAIDAEACRANRAQEKFQDMDAFMWKLSIWASKGRFPLGFDPQRPVTLKQWPNFTRLMITPDALRIAALMTQGPRTALEIAKELNVRPQYVFVLISACYNMGLLEQGELGSDRAIAPELPKADKKKGLLSKILSKLRGE